ncbi:heat shock transcription factor, X-linked member 3-like [Meriones unguiculatus]|uniref:heat shock transcription factor, X-linked member 3-like n=1 Tax=Meriones unguiculatus TaxID=10047 RepID=UPI00293E3FF9|nr:heat shock transcription factor, X-linked member 3-like [Meriones unguiculatus]
MFRVLQFIVGLIISHSVGEHCANRLSLLAGHEPGEEIQPNSSSEPRAYPRRGSGRRGNRGRARHAASQGRLQSERQPTANEERGTDLLNLPFHRKLWIIVHNKAFKSVNWSEEGDTITIQINLFKREVLHRRGARKIFKTNTLKNFIRQLNFYGFKNIRPKDSARSSGENKKMMIYGNVNFQRDKPELLENIVSSKSTDASAVRKARSPITSAGPSPKKNDRPSSQLHKSKGDGKRSHQGAATGPSNTRKNSNIPVSARDSCPPQETSRLRRKFASDNDTVSPSTPVNTEEAGYARRSSLGYLIYGFLRSVYNICYSILKVAISEIFLSEYIEEEMEAEEEEEEKGKTPMGIKQTWYIKLQ